MATRTASLPAHDELGLLTRTVELVSIVAAVGLLGANLIRFASAPETLFWWTPLVALGGMVLADFVSGLVHWTADTWGSETMPVLGRRFLRPFRVHHVNPDDFLRRNFIDTNGDVCMLVVPLLLGVMLIPLDGSPGCAAAVLIVAFCACGMPTNQVHQWAHMPDPPRFVGWLQRTGMLLSREQHARHHTAPYVTNYCIATGWCNRPLAALGFFRIAERLMSRVTGLTPRGDDHGPRCRGRVRSMNRQTSPRLPLPEPTRFGSGWISGVLSTVLGAIGLGAVVCFHNPSLFTMPELRGLYPVPYVRAVLHLVLVGAFLLGALSVCLRRSKILGLSGMALTLLAALLGGSRVPLDGELREGPFLGLDWFLLNLIGYSLVFIPLERLFARRPEQAVFRYGWRTDLAYFFVSALLVQVTTLLTLRPAMIFFDWAAVPGVRAWVGAQPFALQFLGILLLTDFVQYWVHRAFHTVPLLWRFHQIHHSTEVMDWLAGSRLHLVDVAATRGLTYVPIYVLGFAEAPLFAYIAFVSVQATFIHANVRFEFGPLRWLLATPQFHHWHHAAERQAVDKNFAVHLPALDWLFGTFYLPKGEWPRSYGLIGGEMLPPGYVRQFFFPIRRRSRHVKMHTTVGTVVPSETPPAASDSSEQTELDVQPAR